MNSIALGDCKICAGLELKKISERPMKNNGD
jgi:hypothetical protein